MFTSKNLKSFTIIFLSLVLALVIFVKFFTPSNKSTYKPNYETAMLSLDLIFSEKKEQELKVFYNSLPDNLKNDEYILEKYLNHLVRLVNFDEAIKISNIVVEQERGTKLAEHIVFLNNIKNLNQEQALDYVQNYEDKEQLIGLFDTLFSSWYLIQEDKQEQAFKILKTSDSVNFFYRHFARALNVKGDKEQALEMFEKSFEDDAVLSYALVYEYINFLIENNKEDKALEVYGKYFENNVGIDFLKQKSKDFKISDVNASMSDVLLQVSYVISRFDYNTGLQFAYYSLLLNQENASTRTHLASLFLNFYQDSKLAYSLVKDQDLTNIVYYDFYTRNYSSFKDIENTSYENILLSIYNTFPQNYSVLVDLAYLYIANGNYRKATNTLSYIEKNANLEDDKQVALYLEFYKAIIFTKFKDTKNAKKHFENAKKIDSERPIILNYYAYTLIENDLEIDYALEMLEQAMKLSNSPEIIDSYAWGLFKKGKYERAKTKLEQVAVKMPYSIEVNDHIGDVYWQLGRRQLAIYHWQEALRIAIEQNANKKDKLATYQSYKEQKTLQNKINGVLPSYLDQETKDNNHKNYKDFILYYKNKNEA